MKYATFATNNEASYLASLTKEAFWVGVTDSAQEGTFKNFNDATTFNSTFKWAVGEPNNAGGDEDCVFVSKNVYKDFSCEKFIRVLCEIDLPLGPVEIVENLLEVEPANNLFDFIGNSCKKSVFSHFIF